MDYEILVQAGLTDAQAKAYLCLVQQSPITPPNLAKVINETRSNTYKVLEQLEEMSLVKKEDLNKKFHYWALSPHALLNKAKDAEEQAELARRQIETSLPAMLEEFHQNTEQAVVRFFPGAEGVNKIYEDQLKDAQAIEMMHVNPVDSKSHSVKQLHLLRNQLAEAKIPRHVFCVDEIYYPIPPNERMPIAESDKLMCLERTWIKKGEYTAPVEWSVYGDKIAIISYGDEAMGMSIESKVIADSMRQMLAIMKSGVEGRSDYGEMPVHNKFTRLPEAAKKK